MILGVRDEERIYRTASLTEPLTHIAAHPVIIDTPYVSYNALDPCVRWVLNVCKGDGDIPDDNCKPHVREDYKGTWNGLGAYLRCSNAECVCATDKFLHSTDKFYQQADYFCNIGYPYQGKTPQENEAFINTMNMLADYCSSPEGGGSIVDKWLATMYGQVRETGECMWSTRMLARQANAEAGMTTEKTVTIAVGVASCVAAVITVIPALIKLRRKK